ncbi:MBL fold metallo-hydrolase [Palleronia abyssalis]|uniref:Hydroxyacylglutathione hydrolase GloC n=1 Tax=Palleronia abyssalis TaxID=1501240 RepID=A0A2R8BU64_9RHOB|nr:MBL fold metallo-hydrolase [Palleronia abyssalis]SPJ23673.1 Hydroxyacylglutathione hydrolase GloC [Palleronia abyssalis]
MERLEPGLMRMIAPNPGPMTERGTNTYILGQGPFTVIDPGPDDDRHLEAILSVGSISHILVTHAHLDHSPLARRLGAATGAPVLAFGDARAGQSPVMQGLDDLGGGEGVDASFAPDETLADGEVLHTPAGPIRAIWTPGHFGNHLSFAWRDTIFSGDLVMGWASSLVSPPDGDLTAFMDSCRRVRAMGARVLYPGHGGRIDDPAERTNWLISHRESREAQIIAALDAAPGTPQQLAKRVYDAIDPLLLPAATRNVLAHLIDLTQRNFVCTEGELSRTSIFYRA